MPHPVIIHQKRGIGALGVIGILALVGVGGLIIVVVLVALAIGSSTGVRTSVTTSDGKQTISLQGDAKTFTKSQQEAVGSAEDYLSGQNFSRAALVHQLTSQVEGYSAGDAAFAVDHLVVDWNYEAYLAAKTYLSSEHFSRSGLLHQLTSSIEGFTQSQADYGVNKAYTGS